MAKKIETRGRKKLPEDQVKSPIQCTRFFTKSEIEQYGGKDKIKSLLNKAINEVTF